MLLRPPPRFPGFPPEAFEVFSIADREERRQAILAAFHPGLRLLAEDVLSALGEGEAAGLHVHLPQLNWPKGYAPFCTWMSLSRLPHGYLAGPQLGVGIHADHVSARLGWDVSADAFGRFEFRCLHGGLDREILAAAAAHDLAVRVHAAAPWPEGSRLVFGTTNDLAASFREVHRRGVFWELGRRWEIPASLPRVAGPTWSEEVRDVLAGLAPLHALAD